MRIVDLSHKQRFVIEVVWRTDHNEVARRLIALRAHNLERAHVIAQAEARQAYDLGTRPLISNQIGA